MAQAATAELKVLISVVQNSQNSLRDIVTQFQNLFTNLKSAGGAQLQDVTARVRSLHEALDTASAKSQNLGNNGFDAFNKFRKNAEESKGAVVGLDVAVEKLTSTVKFLAGGFLALESVRFIKDIADTAARSDVLATVLHVVGNNAGYTNEALDKLDTSVQSLGITAQASRQAITQLIQAGLDPNLAAGPHGLARAAQDLAVIGGINSSEAFQRMVSAIERGETISLRHLGINVSMQQAEERLANQRHITVAELSQQDKTQALANETLRKAAELTGTYEQAMGEAGKQLTSLPRYTEELANATGKRLQPAYSVLISQYTLLLENLRDIILAQTAQAGSTDDLAETVKNIATVAREFVETLARHIPQIIEVVKVYLLWKTALVFFHTAEGLAGIPARLVAMANGFKAGADAIRLFISGTQAATTAVVVQKVAFDELRAAQLLEGGASATAVASMLATEAAATETAVAVGTVSTAWLGLSGLLAIPLLGYIVYKITKVDENGQTLLGLGAASDPSFFNADEYTRIQKQENLAKKKKDDEESLDALQKARAEVTRLQGAYDALGKAKSAESTIALQQLDDAKARRDLLDLKLNGPTALSDRTISARGEKIDAEARQKDLQDRPHTSLEKEQVDSDVAHATEKYKALNEQFEASLVKNFKTGTELDAERIRVNIAGEKHAAELREERLLEGEKRIFPTTDFSGGQITTKAVNTTLGELRNQLNALKDATDKDEISSRLQKIREGIKSLGTQPHFKDDLVNISKFFDDYKKQAAITQGKLPPIDSSLVRSSLDNAALEIRNYTRAQHAALDNEARANQKAQLAIEEEGAKDRLETVKRDNAFLEDADRADYKQGLITLQDYFQGRRDRINAESKAEIALRVKLLADATAELRLLEKQGATSADIKQASLKEQQAKKDLEAIRPTNLANQQKVNIEESEARVTNADKVKQLEQQVASFYGSENETLDQIKTKYELQEKTLGGTLEAHQAILNIIEQEKFKIDLKSVTDNGNQLIAQKSSELAIDKALLDAKVKAGAISPAQAQAATNELILRENDIIQDKIQLQERVRQLNLSELETIQVRERARLEAQNAENARTGKPLISDEEINNRITNSVDHLKDNVIAAENQIQSLQAESITLISSITTYGKELQKVFTQSLGTAIGDSLKDMRNAGNALIKLGESIRDQIINTFSQEFASRITQAILRGTSGKNIPGGFGGGIGGSGSIFDSLGGLFGLFGRSSNLPSSNAGVSNIGFLPAAEGGLISGPGSGTSDSIIARVSDGEHIMPADKTKQWLPMLEAIRTGKLSKYAYGGLVGMQSIAMSPLIPVRYAAGGAVQVTDGGASSVITGGGAGNMLVQLHPEALNMTMRDWLDHEVARQYGRR